MKSYVYKVIATRPCNTGAGYWIECLGPKTQDENGVPMFHTASAFYETQVPINSKVLVSGDDEFQRIFCVVEYATTQTSASGGDGAPRGARGKNTQPATGSGKVV